MIVLSLGRCILLNQGFTNPNSQNEVFMMMLINILRSFFYKEYVFLKRYLKIKNFTVVIKPVVWIIKLKNENLIIKALENIKAR
ncbi:hypothetical protein [Campylobacter sp. 2014D-0216]|uniref:hypothetical protein n=1 Tax=Campylobacter sp. 2014D-0216 TaxID=1813595 RepID=UPI0018A5A29C|nr:hypothetical protein [Campylobacter sp. 2014D-0216]QOR01768.1 hypothetical protein A0083_03300 [Campylobacter sp. 2014D-0216]